MDTIQSHVNIVRPSDVTCARRQRVEVRERHSQREDPWFDNATDHGATNHNLEQYITRHQQSQRRYECANKQRKIAINGPSMMRGRYNKTSREESGERSMALELAMSK